jgi:hypothetical protein
MVFNYPSGMIMPFDVACPSGWTRVSGFDDLFLRGASSYGSTDGSESHSHTFNPGSNTVQASTVHNSDWGSDEITHLNMHYHSINIAATTSSTEDHIPSYISVIFCEKD